MLTGSFTPLTPLLKVFSDIKLRTAIDSCQLALRSLIDLSAAFDTVDHDILIQKLTTSFGFQEISLRWLQSYLTDRTQSLQFTVTISSRHVKYGVPLGFVLGTLLFNIYTADVSHVIKTHGLVLTIICVLLLPIRRYCNSESCCASVY